MSGQDISNESVRGTCRVFITYSHDSPEHRHRVLALAERLRKDGVDAQLDQYVAGTPARGWPRWMEDRLEWAQFVLVICTETYQRRFLGREEPDKGKGVDWEGSLITLEMYHARSDTSKFVPVLFDPEDKRFIPGQLSDHTYYLLSSEDTYVKLYAFLTGQAGVVPGKLGQLKTRAREAVEPLTFDGRGEKSPSTGKLDEVPDQVARKPASGTPAWLEWLQAKRQTSAWPITAVTFSVFAPPVLIPYQRFLLYLWAHLPGQLEQIVAQMAELGDTKRVGFRTGVAVASGTLLSVRIDVPGFRIPDPIDRITWSGKIANASFIIETPSDIQPGEHLGCATISASGIPIAKVCFTLNLESTKSKPITMLDRLDARKLTVRSAFASYARPDLGKVVGRVQGMKKIVPDLDIFLDVLTLRPGQDWKEKIQGRIRSSETFFLFWSRNAARSVEVEREWRLALAERGITYIDPVPLTNPQKAPPPPELSSLHFDDIYLAYIRSTNVGWLMRLWDHFL